MITHRHVPGHVSAWGSDNVIRRPRVETEVLIFFSLGRFIDDFPTQNVTLWGQCRLRSAVRGTLSMRIPRRKGAT